MLMPSVFFARRPVIFVSIALFLTLFIAGTSFASTLYKVEVTTKDAYETLLLQGYDVVHWGVGEALVLGAASTGSKLSTDGLKWQLVEEDVEQKIAARLAKEKLALAKGDRTTQTLMPGVDSLDGMGGYATFEQLGNWAVDFTALHPDICTDTMHIGYTANGRPLWVFKISDNPNDDEEEMELFINAAIHAREVITPLVLVNFAEYLADNYDSDPAVKTLVDEHEWWFLPVVNPDGYTLNEEENPGGGGMHRKNRTVVPGYEYNGDDLRIGVDLNRNFPVGWGANDFGSSPDPGTQTYRGTDPASEPETQAMIDFINSRDFYSLINYHSFGQFVSLPWGYTDQRHPDQDILVYWAFDMVGELGWSISGGEGTYGVNGGATDFAAGGGGLHPDGANNHIFPFLLEVGLAEQASTNYDWDVYGFWPSLEFKPQLIEEQRDVLIRWTEAAEDPYELLPTNPPVMAELPDTSGPFLTISWTPGGGEYGNTEASYMFGSVHERIGNIDAETLVYGLDVYGFDQSNSRAYEGEYSFYAGSADNVNFHLIAQVPYLLSSEDTLRFKTWYSLEEDWDYAYVVLYDEADVGHTLSGAITTTSDPNDKNWGDGITGDSEGWVDAEFPLDDFVGQEVRLAFFFAADAAVTSEGIYIDNINLPIAFAHQREIDPMDAPATSLLMNWSGFDVPTEVAFGMASLDEEGDLSGISNIISTIVRPSELMTRSERLLPETFTVGEVYPNPFNPVAKLEFSLPYTANVTLEVFNVLGQKTATLMLGEITAGHHASQLDATDWASGLYLVVLHAESSQGNLRAVRKALVIK